MTVVIDTDAIRLTQIDDGITRCRVYTSDTQTYANRDTAAVDYDATAGFQLWTDERDIVFAGKSTPFAYIGFRVETVPNGYGTFRFGYSKATGFTVIAVDQLNKQFTVAGNQTAHFKNNGFFTINGNTGVPTNDRSYTIDGDSVLSGSDTVITVNETILNGVADGSIVTVMKPLTGIFNNTSGFTTDGWLGWVIPGDWTPIAVNGVSAYWIGAMQSSASVVTPATALHLLRSCVLSRPLEMMPEKEQVLYARDIGLDVRKTDLEYTSITKLIIACTQVAIEMAGINLLMDWAEYRNRLWIEDGAVSTTPSFTADAYYKWYIGRLKRPPYKAMSPGKMNPFEYELEFDINQTHTLSGVLGLPAQ